MDEITLAGLRDELETSRKYAQALLEHFDGEAYPRGAGTCGCCGVGRANGEHTVGPRVKQLALRGEPLDPRRPARCVRLHRVRPGAGGAVDTRDTRREWSSLRPAW